MPDDTTLYLADLTTIAPAPARYLNYEDSPSHWEPYPHAVDPQWPAALMPWTPRPPVAAVLEALRQALHAEQLTPYQHAPDLYYAQTEAARYLLRPLWHAGRQRWELTPFVIEEAPCP